MATKKQKNDKDWMLVHIYEKLDIHTEVRIWDVLRWMDENDYSYYICPHCLKHVFDWGYWEFYCKKCKEEWPMSETIDFLLSCWKRKDWILDDQPLKCIQVVFAILFE